MISQETFSATSDRSQCTHLEHVALPWLQVHIQTGIPHIVAASVVNPARQHIAEAPPRSSERIPRHSDKSLGGRGRKIHHDEPAFFILHPAPGENVQAALVVGPSAPLTETPFTIPEDVTIRLFQKKFVKSQQGPDRPALPGGGPEIPAASPSCPRIALHAAALPR